MKTALLVVTIALLLAIVSARGIRDERSLRDSIEKALTMEDELARISMLKKVFKPASKSFQTLKPLTGVNYPKLTHNLKVYRTFSTKINDPDLDFLVTNRSPKVLDPLVKKSLDLAMKRRYKDDEIDDETDDQQPTGNNCLHS